MGQIGMGLTLVSLNRFSRQISTVFGLSPQVGSSDVASVRKGRTSWSTFGMSTHHKFSNKYDYFFKLILNIIVLLSSR